MKAHNLCGQFDCGESFSGEFGDLVRALDPRYPVPGRGSINRELDQVLIELKAKISVHLQSANFVSICCDIWSKSS